MVAASNLRLQQSFAPVWPEMFLPTFDGTKSVLQFQFSLTFLKDSNFPWPRTKFPDISLTLKNLFLWLFPDLWQPCSTSFPGPLFIPSPGARERRDGKKRDPGKEVALPFGDWRPLTIHYNKMYWIPTPSPPWNYGSKSTTCYRPFSNAVGQFTGAVFGGLAPSHKKRKSWFVPLQ